MCSSDLQQQDAGSVEMAYVLLYFLGLATMASGIVTPYPSSGELEVHWILPLAFTFSAFTASSWARSMRMESKVGSLTTAMYNSSAAYAVLLFAFFLWCSFLTKHLQVYGRNFFTYPVTVDRLSYFVPVSAT